MVVLESLASAGERVAFGVNEALDFKDQLDFTTAVKALAGAAFIGLEVGELGLPESEHIRFQAADTGNVPNLEIEAIGDRGRFRCALVGKVSSHDGGEEGDPGKAESSLSPQYRSQFAQIVKQFHDNSSSDCGKVLPDAASRGEPKRRNRSALQAGHLGATRGSGGCGAKILLRP